jgi:hypothetical protein
VRLQFDSHGSPIVVLDFMSIDMSIFVEGVGLPWESICIVDALK